VKERGGEKIMTWKKGALDVRIERTRKIHLSSWTAGSGYYTDLHDEGYFGEQRQVHGSKIMIICLLGPPKK